MNTRSIVGMLNKNESFLNDISKNPTPEKLIKCAKSFGIIIEKSQAIEILANLELQLDFEELESIVGGVGRLRTPLDKES